MNTIIIDDPKVYQGGEMFAKQNHVSLKELVNNYVASLAAKVQSRNKNAVDVSFTQTEAFKKAMDYMDSFVADDFTTPVPVNEDTKAVVAHNKYGVWKYLLTLIIQFGIIVWCRLHYHKEQKRLWTFNLACLYSRGIYEYFR